MPLSITLASRSWLLHRSGGMFVTVGGLVGTRSPTEGTEVVVATTEVVVATPCVLGLLDADFGDVQAENTTAANAASTISGETVTNGLAL
jgi:hypothetical protein